MKVLSNKGGFKKKESMESDILSIIWKKSYSLSSKEGQFQN